MEIGTINGAGSRSAVQSGAANELNADDFLELLVTQLTHQDPLDPTSNEDLLAQLSSIRDIQLSTTLADSLTALTGSQRYTSAAALIGRQVTGTSGDEATGIERVEGIVVGVRFDGSGRMTLDLDNGKQLPLEQLASVSDAGDAAESLVGRAVRGVDPSEPATLIEGIVTALTEDENGRTRLELDTGERLKLTDLLGAA